jgi:hypothetical protein
LHECKAVFRFYEKRGYFAVRTDKSAGLPLVGTWKLESGGISDFFIDVDLFQLYSNGSITEYNHGENGVWMAYDARLIIAGEFGGSSRKFTFELSEDRLTITDTDNDTAVYIKTEVNADTTPLYGKWEFSSGVPVYYFSDSELIEFFVDGTIMEYSYGEGGNWMVRDDRIIIRGDFGGIHVLTFEISGDRLTMTDRDGDIIVYTRAAEVVVRLI